MLQAARQLREQGLDVVVGLAETHGRKETAALLEGIELLPRKEKMCIRDRYQAARVARVRGLKLDAVQTLVAQHTEDRQWGVFGEPRVKVLELNLALDGLQPKP